MKESAENIIATIVDALVFVLVVVIIFSCMIYGVCWGAIKTFVRKEVDFYAYKIRNLDYGNKRHHDEL